MIEEHLPEQTAKEDLQVELIEIILTALKDLRASLGKDGNFKVSVETRLYGRSGEVDSLGLVQLLIDVEERVASRYGVSVILTDEKAMSQEWSPFQTVESLAHYLAALLRQPHA